MTLYKHQLEMIRFIQAQAKALCICPCGSGKTRAALAAVESAFIIAPKRVATMVWPEEAKSFGKSCGVITGKRNNNIDANFYVTNFENANNLSDLHLPRFMTTLFIDEGSKLKGFQLRQGGKRAKLIYDFSKRFERVILMTGTPCSEGLGDLYSQITFLDGGQTFGRSKYAFMNKYHYDTSRSPQFHVWHERPNARQEVLEACKHLCKYFEPDITTFGHYMIDFIYKADDATRKTISVLKKKHICSINNTPICANNCAVLVQKVLHAVSGFHYTESKCEIWESNARIGALKECLEEIGDRCIIVTYWQASRQRILKEFRDVTDDICAFKAGKYKHLVISPAAAGHGLSLQMQSNHMVLYEPFYSCEQYEQVLERIGERRQAQSGLNRPVFYHFIQSDTGIDGEVYKSLQNKANAESSVLAYLMH